jgi:hypothetical protein
VASSRDVETVAKLLERCRRYRLEDMTQYREVFMSGSALAHQLGKVEAWVREFRERGTIHGKSTSHPWETLCCLAERMLNPETVECFHSLLIDAYPARADRLSDLAIVSCVDTLRPEIREVEFAMPLMILREIVHDEYGWALRMDLSSPSSRHWAWYKAAVGEYPGVTPRTANHRPFEDYARDVPGDIQRLARDLKTLKARDTSLAVFLMRHPDHRGIVRWIQAARGLKYATVRMNMLAEDYAPMDITRFALECLKGFEKMEPVNAYGGRAILMQGAPLREEIGAGFSEPWMHPPLPDNTV